MQYKAAAVKPQISPLLFNLTRRRTHARPDPSEQLPDEPSGFLPARRTTPGDGWTGRGGYRQKAGELQMSKCHRGGGGTGHVGASLPRLCHGPQITKGGRD